MSVVNEARLSAIRGSRAHEQEPIVDVQGAEGRTFLALSRFLRHRERVVPVTSSTRGGASRDRGPVTSSTRATSAHTTH